MDKKISTIKERILQFVEYLGVSKELFFQKIGMTYGSFKGEAKKRPLNSDAIETILTMYPQLNPEWLICGIEPMIRNNEQIMNAVNEPLTEYKTNNVNLIPLLPVEAVAGFGAGEWSVGDNDIQERYLVPDFNKIDFMIKVKGSSMYPKYNSGDIVACKKINHKSFIQWNKTHVISTKEQGIMVKRIRKSENDGYFLMVSDNKDYSPFEVHLDDITGVAIVIGTIRLE